MPINSWARTDTSSATTTAMLVMSRAASHHQWARLPTSDLPPTSSGGLAPTMTSRLPSDWDHSQLPSEPPTNSWATLQVFMTVAALAVLTTLWLPLVMVMIAAAV